MSLPVFALFGALTQYERSLTRERVKAGLPSAAGGVAGVCRRSIRASGADYDRTERRRQQGRRAPHVHDPALDADRHAGARRIVGAGEGLRVASLWPFDAFTAPAKAKPAFMQMR
jgi:DNA invertase Pin-like site-specific DNA recombinase